MLHCLRWNRKVGLDLDRHPSMVAMYIGTRRPRNMKMISSSIVFIHSCSIPFGGESPLLHDILPYFWWIRAGALGHSCFRWHFARADHPNLQRRLRRSRPPNDHFCDANKNRVERRKLSQSKTTRPFVYTLHWSDSRNCSSLTK